MGHRQGVDQPRSKGGRPYGATLSKTDYAIIDQIAREGFQTYSELREGPLKGRDRSYSWQLMKRLVRLGVIQECNSGGGGRGILGWSIPRKTIPKLKASGNPEWSELHTGPSYRTSFQHDLILRRIKKLLTASQLITDWVPEHVLKSDAVSRFQYIAPRNRYEKLFLVPDAIVHLGPPERRSNAALELELTRKSRRRIYKKLEAYVTSKDFDYAFFILGSEPLLSVFQEIYRDVRDTSITAKLETDPNEIYFTTLANIQSCGLTARFLGAHDTLSLADLS